jgi:hypothetical protein
LSMQACPTPFYGMEFLHNTRKGKNFMPQKTLKSNRKGKISTPTCSANFLLWLSTYLCQSGIASISNAHLFHPYTH